MAPYSMDLRERVVRAWDASGDADEIAATLAVSRAWVHRLVQRRRETGSIAPRKQTKFRSRVLAGQEARLVALITARPDATLVELRDALPTTAALSTLTEALEPVKDYEREGDKVPPSNQTPLNRVVDAVHPESEVSRRFSVAVDQFLAMSAKSAALSRGFTFGVG